MTRRPRPTTGMSRSRSSRMPRFPPRESFPCARTPARRRFSPRRAQRVWTGANDAEWLSRGVYECFTKENLRYSQVAPLDMWNETNTGTNLPAQIDVLATEGSSYEFLFVAKGGGLGEQDALLPGDQGAPQPEELRQVRRRKAAAPRDLRVPALPPGVCRRRNERGGLHEDPQARVLALPGRAPDHGQRARPPVPRPAMGGAGDGDRPARRASAPSSAASTSRSTRASSAWRATARAARSAWASRAPPTATSRRRSPATGSSLRSSTPTRVASSRRPSARSRTRRG